VLLDRVVECELAFLDELHDDGGDEGLGGAADPEAVVRGHRALRVELVEAACEQRCLIGVAGVDDEAGDACGNGRVGCRGDPRRPRSGGRGLRHARQRECDKQWSCQETRTIGCELHEVPFR
jgi:hypothetical protein